MKYVSFKLIYYAINLDDAFFNQNWAGACGRRWAGLGSLEGWSAGSWIVWVEVGSLQCWSVGSGRGTPLQKGEWWASARASPVAAPMPKSVSF